MIAAAYVEGITPTSRLVLMAIADSSDEHSRLSAPGLPKLRAWSGRSKAQVLRIVAQLERDGLLAQDPKTGAGRVGRRAEWTVFPYGIPAIPHPAEVAARFADLDESTCGDKPVEEGRTDATLDLSEGRISDRRGSHPCDPFSTSSSVSRAQAPRRARPPAPGFPGARATDRPDPRTAPGFYRVACITHPEHHHPCPACADRTADPDVVAGAVAEAKRLMRGPRP